MITNRNIIKVSIAASALALSLIGTVYSQSIGTVKPVPPAPPPPIELVQLNIHQKQLADQYIEAIEQLENTIDDYVIYFEKFDQDLLKQYGVTFESFRKGIESGSYSEDAEKLAADLDRFITLMRGSEAKLRESTSKSDQKLYRLFKNLRREMAVILDIVEDAIAQQPADKQFASDIEAYVEKMLKDNNVRIAQIEQEAFARQYEMALKMYAKMIDDLPDESREEALESISKLESLKNLKINLKSAELQMLTLEQKIAVLEALESVDIDLTRDNEPVIVITNPSEPYAPDIRSNGKKSSGKTYEDERAKTYNGSLGISSSQMPIYITHPRGELQLTGWNKSTISAELYIVIDAPTESARSAFLEATTLKMGQDKDGYFAETVFPSLSNPNTRVEKSILKIKVPSRNRVICNHSFGEATIERLQDGALIKGNNSTINASEIQGRLKIENTLGSVSVDRISGSLQITNTSGQIFVGECVARGRISNSAGLISMIGSKGEFSLVNSGPITVNDHEGDLDVENYDGPVTLMNIEGDVAAYNTLQPLVVENIEGSAILENRNANIRATNIEQGLTASTSDANIDVAFPGPRFEISADHGYISLDLEMPVKKGSKVTATFGDILVFVSGDSDLQIDAVADGGTISSKFSIERSNDGDINRGRIDLGNSASHLILRTSRGSIKINDK